VPRLQEAVHLRHLIARRDRRDGVIQHEPDLDGERGAADPGAPRREGPQFDWRGGPVEEEHVRQARHVRRHQEQGEREQVRRVQLHRNVEGEVEGHDVDQHAREDQRAEERGAPPEQQQAAEDLGEAGEHLVRQARAHEGPQQAHRRHVADRLQQPIGPGDGHLRRDQLRPPVAQHRGAEQVAHEDGEVVTRPR